MSMQTGNNSSSFSKKQAKELLEEIMKQGAIRAQEQLEQQEIQYPGLSTEDYAYLRGKMDAQINLGNRKRRIALRALVVAAVLICAMAAITIGGGALNEYIHQLSTKYDSKGVDVIAEKENVVRAFDGRTAEEHYAEVLKQISGFSLVIPAKLPQGSILEYIQINSDHTHIRMKYTLNEGTLTIREYRAGDDTLAAEYKVLENNKVESSEILVMGCPARFMKVILESGDVRYIVTWADQFDGAYYIEFSGDKSAFNMILDGLKIFSKK